MGRSPARVLSSQAGCKPGSACARDQFSVPVFFFERKKTFVLSYCVFYRNLIRVITLDNWSIFNPERLTAFISA